MRSEVQNQGAPRTNAKVVRGAAEKRHKAIVEASASLDFDRCICSFLADAEVVLHKPPSADQGTPYAAIFSN